MLCHADTLNAVGDSRANLLGKEKTNNKKELLLEFNDVKVGYITHAAPHT